MHVPAIFAFEDDGSLHVYADLAEVQTQYEGVDVEAGIYQFFDARGTRLNPTFIVPNQSGALFGMRTLSWVESGVFGLEPGQADGGEEFVDKLSGVTHLAPNRWFESLEDLRARWNDPKGAPE